mgnify:CR=1 FL=1
MGFAKFEYLAPKTVREACSLLARYKGKAKVIAGGTDLVVQMKHGRLTPKCLINVAGVAGQVTKISLRSTTVVTNDNISVIVPNSDLITTAITNWSHGDPKVRIRIPVGVAYGTDIDKLVAALQAVGAGDVAAEELHLRVRRVGPDRAAVLRVDLDDRRPRHAAQVAHQAADGQELIRPPAGPGRRRPAARRPGSARSAGSR